MYLTQQVPNIFTLHGSVDQSSSLTRLDQPLQQKSHGYIHRGFVGHSLNLQELLLTAQQLETISVQRQLVEPGEQNWPPKFVHFDVLQPCQLVQADNCPQAPPYYAGLEDNAYLHMRDLIICVYYDIIDSGRQVPTCQKFKQIVHFPLS